MRAACVQMCSGMDKNVNMASARTLLAQAAAQGANVALLPENFVFMGGSDKDKRNAAEQVDHSPTLCFLSRQAAKHNMAIVGGSLLLQGKAGRIRNACPAFDADGKLMTLYDKIHLFDMHYQGEVYRESALIEAGHKPVAIQLGDFRAGLSICYDLRFPELYRQYADDGCEILCNVAAFTALTGQAHWQTLLQARAIENQSFVLASAQCGEHPDGRQTWGHSMIIDAWGEVLAELAEGEGVIIAQLSQKHLTQVRQSLPALHHRRL